MIKANPYMHKCITLAKKAYKLREVPVGCVIVDLESKKIISSAYNKPNINKDPTLHAEIIAIRKACKHLKSKVLPNTAIYISLEPCAMCAAAISYAQITQIFYGAKQPKFGALETAVSYFSLPIATYKPEIYGGILEEEAQKLMQDFFKNIRGTQG